MMTVRKIFVLSISLFFSKALMAQSPVLLEACNAIQDSQRRLECLKEITKNAQPSQPKDDGTQRRIIQAINSLNTAIDSSVNFQQFQQLRLDLAKELGVFKSNPSHNEAAASLINDAVSAYTDSEMLWSVSLRSRVSVFEIRHHDKLPVWDIASRYGIPTKRIGYMGPQPEVFNQYGFSLSDGLKIIWQTARLKTDTAVRRLTE